MKTDLRELCFEELKELVVRVGEKAFRAKQIYPFLFKGIESLHEIGNIPKALIDKLDEVSTISKVRICHVLHSKLDDTRKYLFVLEDGNIVEGVLMRYHHGYSVCISSQVGCRMGCRFCASTIDGLVRNLTASEMLGQITVIQREAGLRISNIVLMGSGEPLDNFENLMRFLKVVHEEEGLNIGYRHITVSTCGIVPKIRELADSKIPINLAVSLHETDSAKRADLMPIEKSYDTSLLLQAAKYFVEKTGRRVTFEYALIKGVNDDEKTAHSLAKLLRGMLCHVNLIPLNPVKEREYRSSNAKSVARFQEILRENRIEATLRREMGRDINGACGQLRRSVINTRKGDGMDFSWVCDRGLKRTNNQDFGYAELISAAGKKFGIFVVADGMGGHNKGEVASKLATETFVNSLKERLEQGEENLKEVIWSAFAEANAKVYLQSTSDEIYEGMGTTLVAAVVADGSKLIIANAGDSRAYIFREGEMRQITIDNSYVQQLIEEGVLDPQEAKNHPDRNRITRAVGTELSIDVDFYEIDLKRGDKILLCSDGLSDMLEKEEIETLLSCDENAQNHCEKLVETANKKGGRDNITVICLTI